MKDKIVLAGSIAAIFLVGLLTGAFVLFTHIRVNAVQNAQATMENDLNTRVFPGIQKRFEIVEQGQATAPTSSDKKK